MSTRIFLNTTARSVNIPHFSTNKQARIKTIQQTADACLASRKHKGLYWRNFKPLSGKTAIHQQPGDLERVKCWADQADNPVIRPNLHCRPSFWSVGRVTTMVNAKFDAAAFIPEDVPPPSPTATLGPASGGLTSATSIPCVTPIACFATRTSPTQIPGSAPSNGFWISSPPTNPFGVCVWTHPYGWSSGIQDLSQWTNR